MITRQAALSLIKSARTMFCIPVPPLP
jgi:hypothetical protein